jgi:SOS response regulatory protein OraA/RecX
MKKLSDKQKEMLKLHAKPHKNKAGKTVPGHSKEHMKAMRIMMERGMSFDNSHEATMKILGK